MNEEDKSLINNELDEKADGANKDGLILVADDESAIVELIVECLNDSGYHIITARDGLEAVSMYKEAKPDLIISDIVMPKLDGLSVIKEVQGEFPDLKAILMTGYPAVARDFLSDKMSELGVVCLLEKPLNVLELITTTHLIMSDRKGQRGTTSTGHMDCSAEQRESENVVDFA